MVLNPDAKLTEKKPLHCNGYASFHFPAKKAVFVRKN